MKLNRKYSGVVCETCKLQIHEKLKRGYAKYRSLEKMKSWLVLSLSFKCNFRGSYLLVECAPAVKCGPVHQDIGIVLVIVIEQ